MNPKLEALMKFLGESVEDDTDSRMYIIENDTEDGYEDNYIIKLPASKGWNQESVEQFAEIFTDSNPNSASATLLSPETDPETVYKVYIDQGESSTPLSIDEFEPIIKSAMDEIFGTAEGDHEPNYDEEDFEQQLGSSLDTAMMDHYDMMNGDIGDIDLESAGAVHLTSEDDIDHLFEASLNKLCTVAGKPALAEAVMKLYKVYHPVMEAVDVGMLAN